jgi:hypothetical protein
MGLHFLLTATLALVATTLGGCSLTIRSGNSDPASAVVDVGSAAATPTPVPTPVPVCAGNLPFESGAGTSISPYKICTVAQLLNLADEVGATFQLQNDLDASGISQSIASFEGVFDGNGKKLTGLTDLDCLISTVSNSTIQDLEISNAVSSATALSFLACAASDSTFQDIVVSDSVAVTSENFGSIAGGSSDTSFIGIDLTNVTVDTDQNVGGVVHRSRNSGTFQRIAATGLNFDADGNAAGVANMLENGNVVDVSIAGDIASTGGAAVGVAQYVNGSAYFLGIQNSAALTGVSSMGAVIGFLDGGTVTITEAVNTGAISGVGGLGGILGNNAGTVLVTRSVNSGSITATGAVVGGIIAGDQGGPTSIMHSYNSGELSGSSRVSGVLGLSSGAAYRIVHSYSNGRLTGSDDGIVKGAGGYVYESYFDAQRANTANSSGGGVAKSTAEMATRSTFYSFDESGSIWSLATVPPTLRSTSFVTNYIACDPTRAVQGSGTAQDPFLVCAPGHIADDAPAGQVKVVRDMDFTTYGGWHSVIPGFTALDGQGHVITGIDLARGVNNNALFDSLQSGQSIQSLHLHGIQSAGDSVTGMLVAEFEGGTVSDVSTSGLMDAATGPTGSIAARFTGGTITNVRAYIDSTDEGSGGLFGALVGEMDDSNGAVNLQDAVVTLNLSSATGSAGGIGGAVGSYSLPGGTVSRLGSIFVRNSTIVATSSAAVGGVVGQLYDSAIADALRIMDSTLSTDKTTGGLFGVMQSGAEVNGSSVADVAISCVSTACGGAVGSARGATFSNTSVSRGSVSVVLDSVGGFVGDAGVNLTIYDSYSTAAVTGDDGVGGFVGKMSSSGNYVRVFAAGLVTGNSGTGGFAGSVLGGATEADCFFDSTTTGLGATAGACLPKTTAEMQVQGTFTNFNFTNAWFPPSAGYPLLRNVP